MPFWVKIAGIVVLTLSLLDVLANNGVLLGSWGGLIHQKNNRPTSCTAKTDGSWSNPSDPHIAGPPLNTGHLVVSPASPTGKTLHAALAGVAMASDRDYVGGGGAATTAWTDARNQTAARALGFNSTGIWLRNNNNEADMGVIWTTSPPNWTPIDQISSFLKAVGVPPGRFSYSLGGDFSNIATFASRAAQIAQRFIANGTPVSVYEVLNEPQGFPASRISPTDYAALFNATADAIHAIDPSYKMILSWHTWADGRAATTLGNLSGSRAAGIAYHVYNNDTTQTDVDIMDHIGRTFLGAIQRYSGDAATMRSGLRGTLGADLPLYIHEYAISGKFPGDPRETNYIGAVYSLVALLSSWSATTGVVGAAAWDWLGDGWYGLIREGTSGSASVQGHTINDAGIGTATPRAIALRELRNRMPGSEVSLALPTRATKLIAKATVNSIGHVALCVVNYGSTLAGPWQIDGMSGTVTRFEISSTSPGGAESIQNVASVSFPAMSIVYLTN